MGQEVHHLRMYEGRHTPPLAFPLFMRRLGAHVLVSVALVAGSLGLGMGGYRYYEHLGWRDAFLNAAMLLGGMGPVATPVSPGGKIFAGLYALYAGLVFLVAVGVMLAPIFHRMMHQFHFQTDTEGDGGTASTPRTKRGPA